MTILKFPIAELPPEKPVAVVMTAGEWLAVALKLAGRDHDVAALYLAEAKMMTQLKGAGS